MYPKETAVKQRMGMKVIKVINNNIIKSYDAKNQEVLVMGCGIGFKKKPGDEVEESLVEKIYTNIDKTTSNKLTELLEKVPLEHIQLTNDIISYAKASLGKKLNDNIYLTLTDHISFAIDRIQQGLTLKNALLWEIKRFYNHEYLVGKEALAMIEKRLGIVLPEDEAGFIALHLVNATMDFTGMEQTAEATKIIQQILTIVKYHFQMELDEYSLHYERFITHLKFFVQRVFSGTEIDDEEKSFILMLKEQYPNEYRCALKVRDYMRKEFAQDLSEDELIYLTIHIRRVTTKV